MMRLLTISLAAMLLADSAGAAPQEGGQQIAPAGSQGPTAGPASRFTGAVKVEPLWTADARINAAGAYVTFEPGARSAWHVHPSGQRLVVVAGTA
jgi:quercetin dioxygenase-like cupin family protein